MSRFTKKLVVIMVWAGLGLLLGVQLASPSPDQTTSIEPEVSPSATTSSVQEITVPLPQINSNSGEIGSYTITVQSNPAPVQEVAKQEQDYSDKTPQQILTPERSKPTVDVLADKTATLLQKASKESIDFVVSLFSSATK